MRKIEYFTWLMWYRYPTSCPVVMPWYVCWKSVSCVWSVSGLCLSILRPGPYFRAHCSLAGSLAVCVLPLCSSFRALGGLGRLYFHIKFRIGMSILLIKRLAAILVGFVITACWKCSSESETGVSASVLFEVCICLQRITEVMAGEAVGRAGVLRFVGLPRRTGKTWTKCLTGEFGVWGSSKSRKGRVMF